MADMFTGTKGLLRRALSAWIARATSSLPEPVSPVTSTGAFERETKSMAVRRLSIAGQVPTSSGSIRGARLGGRIRSVGIGRPLRARATTARISSVSHGLTRYSNAPRLMASTASGTPPLLPVMAMNGSVG